MGRLKKWKMKRLENLSGDGNSPSASSQVSPGPLWHAVQSLSANKNDNQLQEGFGKNLRSDGLDMPRVACSSTESLTIPKSFSTPKHRLKRIPSTLWKLGSPVKFLFGVMKLSKPCPAEEDVSAASKFLSRTASVTGNLSGHPIWD
ncbi:hypothetical protein PM082_011985 [Marasmius tenuissimus]|nr:hypothetical protein PM082_011985 [Marasmius tenuissimus]